MASQSSGDELPTGSAKPTTNWGEFNKIAFNIQQALGKMQTATLVKIESCTNSGGVSAVGYVDVIPLVNQLDGLGNPTPHVTIHNVPYFRMQGGANAIICDPEPGDIGLCVFASRDITKVKATKKQANPGSFREYDFADGLYCGGMLNGTPTQYVEFSAAGIRIHSPVKIKLDAPDILLEAPTVEINASTSTTVTTPTFTVNGATTLNGTVSQTGGGASAFSGTCEITGNVNLSGTIDVAGQITGAGVLQGASLVLTGGGATPTTTFPGPVVVASGDLNLSGGGNVTTSGTISGGTVTGGGKNLATHVHTGVQPGAGNSGPPL